MKNWTQIVLLICIVMLVQSCRKYVLDKQIDNEDFVGDWIRPLNGGFGDEYVTLTIFSNGKYSSTAYYS